MQENHRVPPGFSRPRVTATVALFALALATLPAATAASDEPSGAASPGAAPRPVPTYREVAPIFSRWCVRCHGPREQHGELRLDSYAAILRGGDTGPAVTPGDPEGSLLLAKVEHRDKPVMPPRKRLPSAVAARLRAWIGAGAPETSM